VSGLARRWVALTATTAITLTPALPTGTMGLIGSPTECSSALARGIAGVARGAGEAGDGEAVGATDVRAGVMDAAGADVASLVGVVLLAARQADFMERPEVFTVAAVSMALAGSTVEAVASTVEAEDTAVADTGNRG